MKIANLRTLPDKVQAVVADAREGIVDALLNMTWQRASGSGSEGNVIFGSKPSMKFVSGFLLPRYEETGLEDETSDIHISTHGMDFQVGSGSTGRLEIQPSFSIYIQSLPSWEEMNDPKNGIFPAPRLKKSVETAITVETRSQIAAMRSEDKSKPINERRNLRKIQQDIYRALLAHEGVRVLSDEIISENSKSVEDHDAQPSAQPLGSAASDPLDASPESISLETNRGAYIFDSDLAAQPTDVPEKWQRIEIDLDSCSVELGSPGQLKVVSEAWSAQVVDRVSAAVVKWLGTTDGKDWAYRPEKVLPSNFRTPESWLAFLQRCRAKAPSPAELVPSLQGVSLFAEISADLRDPLRFNVRILMENGASQVVKSKRDQFDHAIHQVSLIVSLPKSAHRELHLDRVEPSYRFRDFLTYAAIGVNCGVIATEDENVLRLTTTWMPRYVQPRIIPADLAGMPIGFAELGDESFDPAVLKVLVSEYKRWIEGERTTLDPSHGATDEDMAERERRRFADDLEKYEAELARINLGIELLEYSRAQYRQDEGCREGIPFQAWLLLNQTFLRSGKKKEITSWRLFQMAFILAHVPTLASRMPEYATAEWFDAGFDEEMATLLYFPTGGGKSEAFFGLLIFNLFLDRLRGKSIGITALLRYPLRLLTLQQGQRLLGILVQAELLRREARIDGATFEIGFWVGSGNTPNSAEDERLASVPIAQLGNYSNDDSATSDYEEVNKSFNKIPNCPCCEWMTGLRRIRSHHSDEIAIVCFNSACSWNVLTGSQPLPFLIVDTDIYRHAPAVILGVIDKLALIGQHPSTIGKVMGMFGFAKWKEQGTNRLVVPKREELRQGAAQNGCEEIAPAFQGGREIFVDPFPSLVIQDEAHLLEESLGTFAGLFETLLEELFVRSADLLGDRVAREPFGERKVRLPKIIAATATVSVPEQQFGALYQRTHMRFPYPGTSIYRSFYSTPAPPIRVERQGIASGSPLAPELESPWMRLYVSIMTNGRNHTVTTVSVLSAYHLAITEIWEDLSSEDHREAAVQRLLSNLSEGLLRNFHSDAIQSLVKQDMDVFFTLVDLMRISLTYVTNKKGGDQVIDAFRDEVVKTHRSHGRDMQQLQTELISGGVDVAEIQSIMRQADGPERPGDEFPVLEQTLRNIVATSAISHGVDVDKFNAMFFAGMPNDIAEFIQASSRVGRAHTGFCLLIPTPHARRDRYIVETHDIFHRFLERMIAPPAITRWATAAHDRVLASVFQAWLCGWVEPSLFFRAKDADKAKAAALLSVGDVNRLLVGNDYPKAADDFMNFAVAALGIHGRGFKKIGAAPRADFYEERTRNQAKQLIEEFRQQYGTTRLADYWNNEGFARPPMTSLRDIDEAAHFVLARGYGKGRQRGDDEKTTLRLALRIIRNQTGRVAELDDDEDKP